MAQRSQSSNNMPTSKRPPKTTVIRGAAAAAEMAKMQREVKRQPQPKPKRA
jgi:hypothetical protein